MMKPEGWWQRKRHGMWMTSMMFEVLRFLRAAKESGWPFVHLASVHKRTINSLMDRGWIFTSPGLDGIRYTITASGEKSLKIFEKPSRRFDGICPVCGIRPKQQRGNGRTQGYCRECDKKHKQRQYHLGRCRMNPDRLCSDCKQRPLHRMSGGKLSTYCTECRRKRRATEKRTQHDRDLARIRAGEILLCRSCKKAPRAYTDRYVRDYCPTCQKEYMNRYNDRRRPNNPAKQKRNQVDA